jgi:hypothetical protein
MPVNRDTHTHSLFIKCGAIEVGAIGIPAIVSLLAIAALVAFSKSLGIW